MAALALAGCVVEDPPAPTTVVVTVEPWPAGAAAPAELLGGTALAVELDRTDPWAAAATLLGVRPLTEEMRSLRHVPADVETFPERLMLEGFECGAFLSGDVFDESSGLLQGFLLVDEPFVREAAGADTGARGAAFAGEQFCAQKIPRPLEDGAFAWIHLDLATTDDARATLEHAVAELERTLAEDPAAVLVLASLDATSPGAPVAIRTAGTPAAAPADPQAFADHLRSEMARSLATARQESDR
ncbi:MAG: hypothetical protein R3F34_05875 [Planctomycetota bacterium]